MNRPKESDYRAISSSRIDQINSQVQEKIKSLSRQKEEETFRKNRQLIKGILGQFKPETKFHLKNYPHQNDETGATITKSIPENQNLVIKIDSDPNKHVVSQFRFCEAAGLISRDEDRITLIPNQEKIQFYLDLNTTKIDQPNIILG